MTSKVCQRFVEGGHKPSRDVRPLPDNAFYAELLNNLLVRIGSYMVREMQRSLHVPEDYVAGSLVMLPDYMLSNGRTLYFDE